MTNTIENDDHEELMLLLPLYVNHSLDKVKTLAVEKHLKNCIECQNELAFEKSVQDSISANETDVADISQKNLAKFNAQLDQQLAQKSKTDREIDRSNQPIQSKNASSNSLVERLLDYGRTLLTPGPALGGALALGLCAVLVVNVLSRPGDNGQLQSPVRGCEHEVKQHEVRIATTNTDGVSGRATDILQELFPDSQFTVEALGNDNVLVNLTGDICMIPLLINDLEKLPSVNSVTVD